MATLTKARSLSTSGALRPSHYTFRPSGSQPVVALVSARRSYWASRSVSGPTSGDVYSHMGAYPNRALPHYARHADGLQYAYIDSLVRCRAHATRSASHWAPEDKGRGKSKSKDSRITMETPWETRTRIAGERYLRLMEEHMALLRKDPYWSLFGASELRGVWNPWRNSESLRRRVDENTWKAWEESKKAAEVLKRTVKGEFWQDASPTETAQPKAIDHTAAPTSRQAAPEPEDEYVFDPISNRRVRRTPSKPEIIEVTANVQSARNAPREEPAVTIPVRKYQPSVGPQIGTSRPGAHSRSPSVKAADVSHRKTVALAGFARQPWLVEEGFVDTVAPHLSSFQENKPSAWAAQRITESRRAELRASREQSLQIFEPAATAAPGNGQNVSVKDMPPATPSQISGPGRLKTSLYRAMQEKGRLRYDESTDRRESLDLLRPSDIRAAVAKTAATIDTRISPSPRQRWAALEEAAARTFQAREDRLSGEFAANKWDLRRNWSAYPGDIARTPEELRARRQLLDRSFANSVDLMELEVEKILNPSKAALALSLRAQTLRDTRLPAKALQPGGLLEAQQAYNREQRNIVASTLLQKEIEAQKTAMAAYEHRPRAGLDAAIATRAERSPSQSTAATSEPEQQKYQERELIREIRSIYESTYGVIDTKHRQPKQEERPTKPKEAPIVVKSLSEQRAATMRLASDVKARINAAKEPISYTNFEVNAASTAGTIQATERHSAPLIKSGTKLDPTVSTERAESYESTSREDVLETSVRSFEDMMNKEKKPKVSSQEPASQQPGSAISEHASELTHIKPVSLEASDRLTLELAEIIAQAPKGPRSKPVTVTESSAPQSYILLALDKRQHRVRVTRTTSSRHEQASPRKSIDAIMSHLSNPTEYFDHMAKLEKAGFELVSGGRTMLVYKDTMGRDTDVPLPEATAESADLAEVDRGWGSPAPGFVKPGPSELEKAVDSSRSRPVRRVEESFSGTPPRMESEKIAEEVDEIQKRRQGPFWKLLKATLIIGTLFYSFGVTLEWLKNRERQRLIEEYRREVKRVQAFERKKAEDQSKGFGWGF